jgi:hypothetical protein
MSDNRGQMTENILPLIFCHLFSVLCLLYLPETCHLGLGNVKPIFRKKFDSILSRFYGGFIIDLTPACLSVK